MDVVKLLGSLCIIGSCIVGAAAQAQTGPASAPPAADAADQQAKKARLERMGRVTPKIVNGIPAAPGGWPFAVAIAQPLPSGQLFQYCGGTVISDQWILTAAHCGVQKTDKVIVGRLNLRANDGDVIGIADAIQHPDYNATSHDFDVAVVRLERATTQRPASPAREASALQPGRNSTAVGWGLTQERGQPSDALLQVDIPIIDSNTCATLYEGAGVRITDNMLCAGSFGKDTCQGDSGGGLFVVNPEDGKDQVVGVVSFGIGCARQEFLGVYTRVSQFANWIETTTGVKSGTGTASK